MDLTRKRVESAELILLVNERNTQIKIQSINNRLDVSSYFKCVFFFFQFYLENLKKGFESKDIRIGCIN